MSRRPKGIGTAAETAVARAARRHGFPHADRLTTTGALDRGDVGLCPGVIVEVKGGELARNASDALIESWLHETARERVNANAVHAFLVVQRRGVGAPNAHRWWTYLRLGWLEQLRAAEPRCRVCGCTDHYACLAGCSWRPDTDPPCCDACDPDEPTHLAPVRMLLIDALEILRAAGYGTPPDPDASRDGSGRVRARVASGAAR